MHKTVAKYFKASLAFILPVLFFACKNKSPKVATAIVGRANIVETIIARGNIYPITEAYISSSMPATVSHIAVQEGDTVTRGQIVGYITTQGLGNYAKIFQQAGLDNAPQALSTLSYIESVLLKSLTLIEQNQAAIPDNSPLKAETKSYQNELKNAVQSLQHLKQKLLPKSIQTPPVNTKGSPQKVALIAPISGVVTVVNKKDGESTEIFGGSPNLITIANLNAFEARININEKDISKLKKGSTAEIVIDAYENKTIKGIVTHIAGSIKQSNNLLQGMATENNNIEVKVLLDKASYVGDLQKFISGSNATVTIKTQEKRNVPVVPIAAITSRQNVVSSLKTNADMIFVVGKDNKAFLKPITTGLQDVQNAEILSGLSEGDEIVIAPFNTINNLLQDGMKIRKSTFGALFKK